MKAPYFSLLFLLCFCQAARAQQGLALPDTLIKEWVLGDPISEMLSSPSGSDATWVNFDADTTKGRCVEDGPTPFGWFIEADFSVSDPSTTDNNAFTSCSYLFGGVRNDNWLILPPIEIPDNNYQLCWRSLASQGPAFTDGYKVRISATSNFLDAFGDPVFTAAETVAQLSGPQNSSLDPSDYLFSEGYIHANGFTDTNYFYLPEGGPYRGRLEPHCVSLAEYVGQTIYIAFQHDSHDDSQLQLDDIVVSNKQTIGTHQPTAILNFEVLPNPVVSSTYVKWSLQKAEAGKLFLRDMSGKLLLGRNVGAYEQGQFFLELDQFSAGVYQCTLQTPSGQSTIKLVKI